MEHTNQCPDKAINENANLRQEYSKLQERLTCIETTQLSNNVMLTCIQEQQWEKFEITKQWVIDVIAEAIPPLEGDNALNR